MKRNILLILILVGVIFSQLTYAQQSYSTFPEREIIVHFNDDVLTHKHQASSGTLTDFTISSSVLHRSLDSAKVEAIGALIPNFKKENRNYLTRNGRNVTISDWSKTFIIRIPENGSIEKLIKRLNQIPGVAYAEENGRLESDYLISNDITFDSNYMINTPNDDYYNRQWWLENSGSIIQGSGTIDADIDVESAWNITTGSSSVKIAIIDSGIDTGHEEFQGRISGDGTDSFGYHGTAVAGVATASGYNAKGIAGVAYGSTIINEDYGNGTAADFSNAILSAVNRGAHILNNSWRYLNSSGDIAYSVTVRRAVRDAYELDRTFVASMGNQGGSTKQYPAAIRDGVITVGATTNNDEKASYSSTGDWIDVTAPGGGMANGESFVLEKHMYATLPGNNYGYSWQPSGSFNLAYVQGTSFSAPVVSGIAALLLSESPNLYNDDIENLIEISAEDKFTTGFDNLYGHGRVNAHEALALLQSPYILTHNSTTGGSFYSQSGGFTMQTYDVSGLSDGVQYYVKRVEVRKNITFPYMNEPAVWCRGVESSGWTKEENDGGAKRNFGQGFCEVVQGTLTNTSATLRTYVYNVWNYSYLGGQGSYIGKFPTTESNVTFAYTVHGIPGSAPLSVNIFGPTTLYSGQIGFWSAGVSNGTAPYSYQWQKRNSGSSYWYNIGTNSSYSGTFSNDVDLKVIVTDSNNNTATDIISVSVSGAIPKVIGQEPNAIPENFGLTQNYPNPFNPITNLAFELPEQSQVSLTVFNIMGQKVTILVDDNLNAGFHTYSFEASSLPSGVYVAQMEAIGLSGEVFSKSIKMQLIK